jgi:molecular chaperone DnaJ
VKQRGGIFAPRRECLACAGAGEVPIVRCGRCAGTGLLEREKEYVVRVPAGSVQGTTQRVAGEGSPGRRGGPSGDLFVTVRVRPHAFYREEGGLLVCELPLSPSEAALGADVEVFLLDSTVRMKVPAGTQSGSVFRLRGKGLPRAGQPRGDAHVRVVVETPQALSEEARALLERMESLLPAESLPRRRAFRELGAPAPAPVNRRSAEGGKR